MSESGVLLGRDQVSGRLGPNRDTCRSGILSHFEVCLP